MKAFLFPALREKNHINGALHDCILLLFSSKFCIICYWLQLNVYNFYQRPSSQDNLPLWLPPLMQSQPQWRALVSRSGDSIWRPRSNKGHDEVRDRAPTKYYRVKGTNTLSAVGPMKQTPLPYSTI